DFDNLLLLARLVLLLLLLVLELAEVEDLAHRRISVWGDFHQIEAGIGSHRQCLVALHDSHHLAAFVDEAKGHHADLLVDPRTVAGGREVHRWSSYLTLLR